MNNKEKYQGKVVNIFAPSGGRKLDVLNVISVEGKDLDVIYGTSELSGIETAYYLSDGIRIEIIVP